MWQVEPVSYKRDLFIVVQLKLLSLGPIFSRSLGISSTSKSLEELLSSLESFLQFLVNRLQFPIAKEASSRSSFLGDLGPVLPLFQGFLPLELEFLEPSLEPSLEPLGSFLVHSLLSLSLDLAPSLALQVRALETKELWSLYSSRRSAIRNSRLRVSRVAPKALLERILKRCLLAQLRKVVFSACRYQLT